MSNVIQMHETRAARSRGVALAVACAAFRLGLTPAQVIRCAQMAAERVRGGQVSAAKAVSDAKADITASLPAVSA